MVEQQVSDARMGKAIVRGILLGIPVVLVGLTAAVWLITGLGIGESLATAALPGILLGAFGGGFVGVATTMKE